jgi:uncharacterized protein YjbJ (UPF0337 family)
MNTREEGFFQRMRGKVKSTWGDLTDDDFTRAEGSLDKLVGFIKEKTGQAEETIRERLHMMEKEDEESRTRSTT